MRINAKAVASIIGLLLLVCSAFMALCLPVSWYYGEDDWRALLFSAILTGLAGAGLWQLADASKKRAIGKKDGYLVVALGWIVISIFGMTPYLISGAIPDVTDAFFETISGFTTTGATILDDIEALPHGILLWRSLTQWIGGMGIIVLAVAILPILGIGGMQLFVAEAPGITPDKLQPRIKETAQRLWFIYVGLTLAQTALLKIGGLGYFDAFNHALTTMASGGFSTRQASIAAFSSPFIQYVIIVFMFLAGTNFTLIYFGLRGQFSKMWRNEEFRMYLFFTAILTIVVTSVVLPLTGGDIETALRESLFQIVSILTTTGYATYDYTAWTPALTLVFFALMFFGASAGSTSGGVKLVRHIVLLKNSLLELKRQVHPSAIIPVKLNKKAIGQGIVYNVLAFIMIYILIFAIGSVIMASLGVDFITAVGAVASSLGNVGPGIGAVGPAENFASLPIAAKWLLALLMLLGRLELFTVLILFTPYFWRRY